MNESKTPTPRDVESTRSVSQFVVALRKLADSLEQGKPHLLQVAGEKVQVPAGAALSIEHERDGDEEELEFQMRWPVEPSANGKARGGA